MIHKGTMTRFSKAFNRFKQVLGFYNKFSLYFIGGVFCFLFIVWSYIFLFKIPHFLFTIKDGIIENSTLVEAIGGHNDSYDFYYPPTDEERRPFRVTVNGNCPEAKIIINGFYTSKTYVITDTVLVKCHSQN